jgi:ribosome-associated protein
MAKNPTGLVLFANLQKNEAIVASGPAVELCAGLRVDSGRMDAKTLLPDVQYHFSRSGGKGGQNVNKVSTKAELRFSVRDSPRLTDDQRALLLDKWANKLTTEGELVLTDQTDRSQLGNKERVTKKFLRLVAQAFVVAKPRRPTRPKAGAVAERLTGKARRSDLKDRRKRVDF